MKTDWDYTTLADAYLKRPDYSEDAIDKMIALAGLNVTFITVGGGPSATSEQAPLI